MKPHALIGVSALALTAAACGPKVPVARAALDCPPAQGDLTRTAASADGRTCAYVTSAGAEVALQLVSVQGSPDATLQGIETVLLANRAPAKPIDQAKGGETSDEGDKVVKQAAADAAQGGVHIEVGKDGDSTVITEQGGSTRVNLPGIHIVANDANDTANVKIGPLTVNAGDGGATVRMRRDVRLRGEALNPEKRGLRATFIYTGEDLPEGYRFVGYEAGGPKRGPIVVAVVRSKTEGPDGGELYPDIQKLVRRNGGV